MIDTTKQVKEITYNGTPLTLYQEDPKLQEKIINITENGSYTTVHSDGFDGLGRVDINVNVPIPEVEEPVLQSKMVDITSNGSLNITPDDGYDGLSSVAVTVNVAGSGDSSGVYKVLDEYDIAYRTTTNLMAATGLSITVRYNAGASARYAWFIDSTALVGGNIMDYLKKVSATSTSKYYFGYYYPGTSATPTLDNMKSSTYYNEIGIFKYNSVSIGVSNSLNMGNLVLFDRDGKILVNDTWENVVIALNARTIDISNGIYLGCTNVPNSSNATTDMRTCLTFS